jgi:hypothetical protein
MHVSRDITDNLDLFPFSPAPFHFICLILRFICHELCTHYWYKYLAHIAKLIFLSFVALSPESTVNPATEKMCDVLDFVVH